MLKRGFKLSPLMSLVSLALLLVGHAGQVAAAETPAEVSTCAACHQLEQNAEALSRLAPPLFYAGNKFRREWLEQWLQAPVRIRPAGGNYADHVVSENGVDSVDTESLPAHTALDEDTAQRVASWLMTLKPYDHLTEAASGYTPGSVSPRLGAMDFVKFKGCGGCHRDTPEYGGLSAPELYTAWQRLQPGFIVSYIGDPQAWDPHSAMPNRNLNPEQVHKLANYLKTLTAED